MQKIKQLIILLVCLFINTYSVFAEVTMEECEYTPEYTQYLQLSEEEKQNVQKPTMCKPEGIADKFIFKNPNKKLSNVSINDKRFNLNDYNLVTSIKDQSTTSACWAFATNASLESNLLMNDYGYVDLSEAHMELATQSTYKYGKTFNRPINTGGNYFVSSSYLMTFGAVTEGALPFSKLLNLYNDKIEISESEMDIKSTVDVDNIAFLGSGGKCNTNTINDIKEYLITNGALASTVYSSSFNTYKEYNYYNGEEIIDLDGHTIPKNQSINHGVTIIGWDDTISKYMFGSTNHPSRDGAFIVKNSYGERVSLGQIDNVKSFLYNTYREKLNINSIAEITNDGLILLISTLYGIDESQVELLDNNVYISIGNKGFEYISYDDVYICNNVVGFFGASLNPLDYSYYYDYLGYNSVYTVKNQKELYLVSIFDKKSNQNEQLEEISMYFPNVHQKYEIYFANGEESDINNAIKIGTGESDFIGYKTIPILSKPIITGNKYTILIKVTSDNDVELGVSNKMTNLDNYDGLTLTGDVQYMSFNGKDYVDVTNINDDVAFQLTIKAYTNKTIRTSSSLIRQNRPSTGKNIFEIKVSGFELINQEGLMNFVSEYKSYFIGGGIAFFGIIIVYFILRIVKNQK